jgi:hypothetical protein
VSYCCNSLCFCFYYFVWSSCSNNTLCFLAVATYYLQAYGEDEEESEEGEDEDNDYEDYDEEEYKMLQNQGSLLLFLLKYI